MGEIRSHKGLRGVAALLVVFYHFHLAQPHLAFEDWTRFFQRGYLMVDLFFILSGFIISYVYDRQGKPVMQFAPFLMKRLIRLCPLHIFCLFLYLFCKIALFGMLAMAGKPVAHFWDDADFLKFFAQLFLVHAWLPTPSGWNIPSWSISAEIFAYCLFPFAALGLRRWGGVASMALLAASIAYYAYVGAGTGSLDVVYGTAPLRCLAGFLLGMLVCRYSARVAGLSPGLVSAGQFLAVAAMLLFLAFPVNDVLIIPPFILLIALTWTDAGWLSRFLSRRTFQFLGEISYSVYLTHVPLFVLLFPLTLAFGARLGLDPLGARALFFAVGTTAVIAFSCCTYRFIEVPARNWHNRKWEARRAAARLGQRATV